MTTGKQLGRFIVIEGLDGAGKTSLISDIKEKMIEWHQPFLITQGIGGTDYGMALRQIVLSPMGAKLSPESQCMLFMSAASELVETVIAPAMDEGRWVICDRFHMSTYAYQYDSQQLEMLMRLGSRGLVPDLTLYLDVDYVTSQKRIALSRSNMNHFDASKHTVFETRRRHMLNYITKHCRDETIASIPTHMGLSYETVRSRAFTHLEILRESTER